MISKAKTLHDIVKCMYQQLLVYKLVRTDRVTVVCELPIDQKITPVYPIEIGFNGKDMLNAF